MNVHDPNNNDDLNKSDNGTSKFSIDGIQKEFDALVKVSVCFFIVNLPIYWIIILLYSDLLCV